MYPLYTEAFCAVPPRQYEKILIFRDALMLILQTKNQLCNDGRTPTREIIFASFSKI